MSKASNKLTAGLRKVKEQQADTSANRAKPEAAARKAIGTGDESRPVTKDSSARNKHFHPVPIWPD